MALYLKFFAILSLIILISIVITGTILIASKTKYYGVFLKTVIIYFVITLIGFGIFYFFIGDKIKTIDIDCKNQSLLLTTDNNKNFILKREQIVSIKTKKHLLHYGGKTYNFIISTKTGKYKSLSIPENAVKPIRILLEEFISGERCKDTIIDFSKVRYKVF